MNKISIIMPVFNAGGFLYKSINSLLVQKYKNIEILCINDGSTDDSLDILQGFGKRDSRIKIFSQENKGPASARNVGLKNATGEYLMFCDADDSYTPDMCEKMLNAIIEHDVDFAICNSNVINEKKASKRKDSPSFYKIHLFGKKSLEKSKSKSKVNILVWNKIFKKSKVDKYKMSFPDGCIHDDDAFVAQYITLSSSAYFLKENLYNYLRREEGSIMANHFKGNSTSTDQMKVAHFLFEKLSSNNCFAENANYFQSFYRLQFKDCYFMLQSNLRDTLVKDEKKWIEAQSIAFNNKIFKQIKDHNIAAINKYCGVFSEKDLPALERKLFYLNLFNLLSFGLFRGLTKKIRFLESKINFLGKK